MAVAGVAGGVFAASASHPFDTIKTRMQAHMYSRPEYATWTSTASTIYAEGGILNFWRGLLPRMTRIIGAHSAWGYQTGRQLPSITASLVRCRASETLQQSLYINVCVQ
jgi:Mitochondrial carrier protein